MSDVREIDDNGPIELPIDGILDLHTFSPKDLKHLIPDYLDECRKADILQVRIIHGKGIGNLRRTVHAILRKLPAVREFKLADEHGGGWGATLVELRRNSHR
jgi:DNA-nicking Smr family endonuclease